MSINASFIEALCERLDKDKINKIEIDGKTFTNSSLVQVKPDAPKRPDTIMLSTLSSLADYIEDNVEGLKLDECMIHIEAPNLVRLASKFSDDEFKQRTIYVKAQAPVPVYAFGREQSQEQFILALNTMFEYTEDRDKVLSLVRNIVTEESITSTDDGLHQTCIVKTGAVKVNTVEIPSLIALRPFRYFLEVEQVTSKFQLRMRQGADKKPLIMLFEVDGGTWVLEAIKKVKAFLEDRLSDITILA